MPRNKMKKDEIKTRVLKLKNELYSGQYTFWNEDNHDAAHEMLNKVLNIHDEYRE